MHQLFTTIYRTGLRVRIVRAVWERPFNELNAD